MKASSRQTIKLLLGHALLLLVLNRLHQIFQRKTTITTYLKENAHEVTLERLLYKSPFNNTLRRYSKHFSREEPPLVLIFNQHVTKLVLNWLCNTRHFHGVHSRLILVTLDAQAEATIAENYPTLTTLHLPTSSLKKRFRTGAAAYYHIFVLRTNLMRAFHAHRWPVFMVQQDTLWTRNALEDLSLIRIAANDTTVDIHVDQSGHAAMSYRRGLINGECFMRRC